MKHEHDVNPPEQPIQHEHVVGPNEDVKKGLARVKQHLQDNKTAYIAGTTGVICLIVGRASNSAEVKNIVDSFNVKYKSPTNNIVITELTRRGHPGNIIRCIETGEVFASQRRAAAAMGLHRPNLVTHLNGGKAHVNGFHFENLGEAVA